MLNKYFKHSNIYHTYSDEGKVTIREKHTIKNNNNYLYLCVYTITTSSVFVQLCTI